MSEAPPESTPGRGAPTPAAGGPLPGGPALGDLRTAGPDRLVEALRALPGTRPAADWPAPRQLPATYPGPAPDGHYLLAGDAVVPLVADEAGGALRVRLADGTPVDDVLARLGGAPLAERVPALAYGANRSPHSLAMKLAHHGYTPPGPASVLPVLAGTVADLDVVAAGFSWQGFVYADLVPSPGTRVSVLVTLLDPGQVAAINDSEGVGRGLYECAFVPGFEVEGTATTFRALAYAGCRPVFVSPEAGTPVAFSAIAAAGRRFPADEQVGLLAHVLRTTGALAEAAALLRLGGPGAPAGDVAVARELVRLVSGQWWYAHNTDDRPMGLAVEAERLVSGAMAAHAAPESTAERLAAQGDALTAEAAYACGPGLRLAAHARLA